LISPTGARTTIAATIPDAATMQLADVSEDGTWFLFGGGKTTQTYDSTTQKWSRFTLPGVGYTLRLTRPSGSAVLALSFDPSNDDINLPRWSLGGTFQTMLPYAARVSGPQWVLPSADGVSLAGQERRNRRAR